MIEGVGTNLGLMYSNGSSGGLNPYLLCQHKDGERTYVNPCHYYEGGCVIPTTGIETQEDEPEIVLYPNPAEDKIFIKDIEIGSSYEIFSFEGKKMTSGLVGNGSIDVQNLPCGTYIIKIKTDDKYVSYKFVK